VGQYNSLSQEATVRTIGFAALSISFAVSVQAQPEKGQPQYVSSSGEAYYARPPLPDAENQVAEAEKKLASDPRNVELILALGNAQAGIWRIREALATSERGLEVASDSAALVSSRGHRHLTLRKLDSAQADLDLATELDDRIPEAWYYLAVVHYLNGSWDLAATAWERRIELSKDYADSLPPLDWLYMTYRRAGRHDDAARLLSKVESEKELSGGASIYQNRLLFYKGVKSEADVAAAMTDDVTTATLSYGLGNWYVYQASDRKKAREYFEKTIGTSAWVALAFIAAERDLARLP
jgi:tetratricopeptide (TPR) repeat protein